LQQILYAEHRQSLLILFQAMDTGGKDGTIRAAVRIRVKNTQIDDSATNCLGAVEIG
jgi:polyphosphate kinase 2 (PPK2 family)